ncbi:GTPase IMAP family member 8-like [Lepisosteus oculatus]|uniref:GTPase IMAP family member 8-like n=1 Tax=Lepisosteus oculatus TaxID=7918 RepID=UPI0035F5188D
MDKSSTVLDPGAGVQAAGTEEGRAVSHEAQRLSELRIVLLGERVAGKSSAGNTILGRKEFVSCRGTEQSVRRQGEVAGRQVTVVDTPGWYIVEEVQQQVGQEVVRSASLCPPGPHAILLVTPLGSVTDRTSAKEHLELLGETAWRHTLLLFTWGDRLGDTALEQHIQTGGQDLQWLLQKCGNRYHVLNNQNRQDSTQVTELLEKIEQLLAESGGSFCHPDRKTAPELAEGGRALCVPRETAGHSRGTQAVWRQGMRRPVLVIKQEWREDRECWVMEETPAEEGEALEEERGKRQTMEALPGEGLPAGAGVQAAGTEEGRAVSHEAQRLSELRIVLLGERVAGKSSAGNTILGRKEFVSCRGTEQSVRRQGEVAGRQVTVVDTPGWYIVEEVQQQVGQEVVRSASLCPPGPHAILLVTPLGSVTDRTSAKEHLELLGKTAWRHTLLLFTWGDRLGDTALEQHIQTGGQDLQWLLQKCGNRYHVLNNQNRQDSTQVTELLEKIEQLLAENSGEVFLNEEVHQEVERMRRRSGDDQEDDEGTEAAGERGREPGSACQEEQQQG